MHILFHFAVRARSQMLCRLVTCASTNGDAPLLYILPRFPSFLALVFGKWSAVRLARLQSSCCSGSWTSIPPALHTVDRRMRSGFCHCWQWWWRNWEPMSPVAAAAAAVVAHAAQPWPTRAHATWEWRWWWALRRCSGNERLSFIGTDHGRGSSSSSNTAARQHWLT